MRFAQLKLTPEYTDGPINLCLIRGFRGDLFRPRGCVRPLWKRHPPLCLSVTIEFGFVIAVCSWFITFCPTWWRWTDEQFKVGLTALITDASRDFLIGENSTSRLVDLFCSHFIQKSECVLICLFVYLFISPLAGMRIQFGVDSCYGPSRFHEWLTKLGPDVLINKEQALNQLVHWERADSLASVISFSSGVSSKNSLAANHT